LAVAKCEGRHVARATAAAIDETRAVFRTDVGLAIFDCDGVLVDSEVISNEALLRALAAEGLRMTLAECRRDFQGLLLADVAMRAEQMLGRRLPDDWVERYEHDRDLAFLRDLRPVDGAAEALRRISAASIPVCVASQGKLEKMELTLGHTGLRGLFGPDALFSAYSVARGKPHPDLFLHAAATMEVEPGLCIVVEDSPSGVAAAVAAGMLAIGYTADSDERALTDAGAQILIASMHELPARLALD
jgi:HAD superfamily hydrolase (TIGR01509 family)